MKVLIQRVAYAHITVANQKVASSDSRGILALVGFGKEDSNWQDIEKKLKEVIEKITTLRIFANEKGRFDLSLIDIKGVLTLVPQFTLYADTSKGRRPEFFSSLAPQEASPLFDRLIIIAKKQLDSGYVQHGIFGADMKIDLRNDGPVSMVLEF